MARIHFWHTLSQQSHSDILQHDLGIFLPTKSASLRLFHWYKIKLIGPLKNSIILVYEHFRNFNHCIFNNNKKTLKWRVYSRSNYMQFILGNF